MKYNAVLTSTYVCDNHPITSYNSFIPLTSSYKSHSPCKRSIRLNSVGCRVLTDFSLA